MNEDGGVSSLQDSILSQYNYSCVCEVVNLEFKKKKSTSLKSYEDFFANVKFFLVGKKIHQH